MADDAESSPMMAALEGKRPSLDAEKGDAVGESVVPFEVILSFDVESHARIDAARDLTVEASLRRTLAERVVPATSWLLDALADRGVVATFFVLGEVAQNSPGLVRKIQESGHEVASHGWNHRRVLELTPAEFREDLRKSRDVLEQITGKAVEGYRAPTFSVTRHNPWAVDVLSELGFRYDSSIFPVRHDRYGVPEAPRAPFLVSGTDASILEFPPATLRVLGLTLPVGGGGYFRLFPKRLLNLGLGQIAAKARPSVAMLYFHPWEFDEGQPRLRLRGLRRFRTYVGMSHGRRRFRDLLGSGRRFATASSVANRLLAVRETLATLSLAEGNLRPSAVPF